VDGAGLLWTGGAWGSLFTTLTLSAVAAPITADQPAGGLGVVTRQKFAGCCWSSR
jgi:iron(III) transport system permease protein